MNNNCEKFDCLLMWVVSFLNWFHKSGPGWDMTLPRNFATLTATPVIGQPGSEEGGRGGEFQNENHPRQ